MEAVIIALIEYVGAPLVLRLLAARTPRDVAEATLRAEYDALEASSRAAAEAIINAG